MAVRRTHLLALAFLLALSSLGPVCSSGTSTLSSPPAVEPEAVRSIEDFVSCLNGRLGGNPDVDIADTVQCLPSKCSITLTMSNISAQPACFGLSGCQMPRVLLTCPGPPLFMPSYLLCATNEGSERVEIGEAIDEAGNMRMADIHIHPGAYTDLDPADVLSVDDDKGCNSNGSTCHDTFNKDGDPFDYSKPIDPWDGTGNGNPDCIIDTDRCDQEEISEPKTCFEDEDSNPRNVHPESLAEVCECIRTSREDPEDPISHDEFDYIEELCDALVDYQSTRGACAMADCPSASGPECVAPDEPCDPTSGAIVGTASGYHCRVMEDESHQCVSDCPCRDWDLAGGGKFLVNGAVCMARLELDGLAATPDPAQLEDDDAIAGSLSAFNYLTRTQIESVSFASLTAGPSGSGFTASGTGKALVNGVETNVSFTATQDGTDASLEVYDADTDELLCGSAGEDGRAGFELSVGP
jgi:hypothetical protein